MRISNIVIFLFLINLLQAQNISSSYLLKIKPLLIPKYEHNAKMPYLKIRMQFADDSILNRKVLKSLSDKQIMYVDLVYSDYKEVKSFDQPELNFSRYENLRKAAPFLFENTAIQWRAYAQTGCNSPEACSDFFHGFYIYFQNPPTMASMASELKTINKLIEEKDTVLEFLRPYNKKTGYYYEPILKAKREKGIHYKHKRIFARKKVYTYDACYRKVRKVMTMYDFNKSESGLVTEASIQYNYDTVVFTVLSRQTSWKDMVVVQDVTGSMSPYTQQVLRWISLSQNRTNIRSFVFFNDGDMKNDFIKRPGKTGGIYTAENNSTSAIISKMRTAMKNGYGGDAPENDVEAILSAQNSFPNANEFILIADNFSNMRDYKLINEIKKPVRVIICGGYYGINTQYLDLARKTGGSIHTIEEDLLYLEKLREGESITINKLTYMIKNGKFVVAK